MKNEFISFKNRGYTYLDIEQEKPVFIANWKQLDDGWKLYMDINKDKVMDLILKNGLFKNSYDSGMVYDSKNAFFTDSVSEDGLTEEQKAALLGKKNVADCVNDLMTSVLCYARLVHTPEIIATTDSGDYSVANIYAKATKKTLVHIHTDLRHMVLNDMVAPLLYGKNILLMDEIFNGASQSTAVDFIRSSGGSIDNCVTLLDRDMTLSATQPHTSSFDDPNSCNLFSALDYSKILQAAEKGFGLYKVPAYSFMN